MSIDVFLPTDKNFNKNREIDISQFMPTVLRDVDEVNTILLVQNDAMKKIWDNVEEVFDNQYICTSKESGIELFENMHSIKSLDTATLEERRLKLWILYNQTTPLTRKYMINFLDTLLTPKNYELSFDTENFTVSLTLKFIDDDFEPVTIINQVFEWIEEITPYTMIIDRNYQRILNLKEYIAHAYCRSGSVKVKLARPRESVTGYANIGTGYLRSGRNEINIYHRKHVNNYINFGFAMVRSGGIIVRERND